MQGYNGSGPENCPRQQSLMMMMMVMMMMSDDHSLAIVTALAS